MTALLSTWTLLTTAAGTVAPAAWSAPRPRPGPGRVWVHGASAGEVKAARSAWDAVGRPGDWVLTTGTHAGLTAGADARAPRDVPRRMRECLEAIAPEALVLIESELWPNLLAEAGDRGVPVGVLGARISPRSFERWLRRPRTARALLGQVGAWAAASEADAARLVRLGAPAERVQATGWLKAPSPPPPPGPGEHELLQQLTGDGPTVVLGSLHPGEVSLAAQQLADGELAPTRSRWVIVPRHQGAHAALRDEAGRHLVTGRWVLDPRFGRLTAWYGLADAALVGGGATGRGTHDVIEPLAAGLRPMFWRRRGDPAEAGGALLASGLGDDLDTGRGQGTKADAAAVSGFFARRDGRHAGLEWLATCGVPVLP